MKQDDVFECINTKVRKELQGVYNAYNIVYGESPMNSLDLLREHLQKALNSSTESDCYQEALADAIYSCQFNTSTALEQWINIWISGPHNYEYTRGVAFVEEKWHQITGMF